MPIFDFSPSGIVVNKSGQRLYCAVAIPLTITVLLMYMAYLVWMKRINGHEDRKAREEHPRVLSVSS